MKELNFDSGMEEFSIQGGGVLRFNPGDPNIYGRFLEAEEKFNHIQAALTQKAAQLDNSPKGVMTLMGEADRQIKELLNWVFGGDNDFDRALGGVNLLAVAGNGQRVAENLFGALEEILTAGAERFAAEEAARIREEG